jgi:hypothetical protein
MRVKRWLVVAMSVVPVLATSCSVRVGCTVYKFFETGLTKPFVVDKSACVAAPPPVISEVPYAVLLPIAAALVIAGAVLFMRRRRVPASSI